MILLQTGVSNIFRPAGRVRSVAPSRIRVAEAVRQEDRNDNNLLFPILTGFLNCFLDKLLTVELCITMTSCTKINESAQK